MCEIDLELGPKELKTAKSWSKSGCEAPDRPPKIKKNTLEGTFFWKIFLVFLFSGNTFGQFSQ